MVTLNFALMPEAAARVHDLLVCLHKFSDTVAIEARRERFTFTALNSSKSAYAALTLDGSTFFSKYEFVPNKGRQDGRFTCSMYTKALLSVFKGRLHDPSGRDGAISRCEVSVQDQPNQTACRFIIRMFCNQGVIKTYKLTYEAVEVMHALFDRNVAKNRWSMQSGALKEYIEYFGAKTEMLDIYAGEDGRGAVFKSYTEKIANGKEVLKHPLVTAVAVNTTDFDEFKVDPGLHIIISVKDFKAIVSHADTLKTSLKAYYSQPTRPLQFSYGADGLICEFTLMTSGAYTGAPSSQTPALSRAHSRAQSTATERSEAPDAQRNMPPPVEPASRRSTRRTRPPGSQRVAPPGAAPEEDDNNNESLFIPERQEEDHQWDPMEYNDEQETLGWDASAAQDDAAYPTFRDSGSLAQRMEMERKDEGVAPTQRVSQIKGLW